MHVRKVTMQNVLAGRHLQAPEYKPAEYLPIVKCASHIEGLSAGVGLVAMVCM